MTTYASVYGYRTGHFVEDDLEWCLYAVSGDCSSRGMSDVGDVIQFKNKHSALVASFLRAQLEWDLCSCLEFPGVDQPSAEEQEHRRTVLRDMFDRGHELIEAGVFHHKWHVRTQWALGEPDEFEGRKDYRFVEASA